MARSLSFEYSNPISFCWFSVCIGVCACIVFWAEVKGECVLVLLFSLFLRFCIENPFLPVSDDCVSFNYASLFPGSISWLKRPLPFAVLLAGLPLFRTSEPTDPCLFRFLAISFSEDPDSFMSSWIWWVFERIVSGVPLLTLSAEMELDLLLSLILIRSRCLFRLISWPRPRVSFIYCLA